MSEMAVHPHALFGVDNYAWRGKARATDPDTSRQAAARQGIGVKSAILAVFALPYDASSLAAQGLTAEEVCDCLPEFYPPTVVTAISRLRKDGMLRDSGTTRPSRRGAEQIVWTKANG